MKLALHTWTLLSTPFGEILRVAARTGWDGIELSRLSLAPNSPNALPVDEVATLIRTSGVPVACVGVEPAWMWADGAERARLLDAFDQRCLLAASLDCRIVMSPVDTGDGDVSRAAKSIREVGDIAQRHGVRLAVEFNSQAALLNTLGRARELMAAADHPACGLLLDTYHLGRSGASLAEIDEIAPREIVHVQFSDVPRSGVRAGYALDRLPPGEGRFPFREFFATLRAKDYAGFMAYEAPNEAAWTRGAEDVAREALVATRAVL